MRFRLLLSGLGAFICGAAAAQAPVEPWIVYGRDGLQNPTFNLHYWITSPVARAVGENAEIYYSVGAGEVWEMQTVVPGLTRLGTAPGIVTGLCVAGDKVWFATDQGRIGSFLRGQPMQTPVMLVDLRAAGVNGTPERMATDGRELFIFTLPSPGQNNNLFALDTANGGMPVRAVATIPYLVSDRVGAGGSLWIAVPPVGIARLDPWTGAQSAALLPVPASTQQGAVDAWDLRMFAVMNYTYPPPFPGLPAYSITWFYEGDMANGVWQGVGAVFSGLLPRAAATSEAPYTIYGRGCPHSQQVDARLAFSGRPRQGESMVLRVRQGEPGALTLLWLGTSNTHWAPLGSLPADLGPIGAPGCRVLASIDLVTVTVADGSGTSTVSFPVPFDPMLAGARLYGQGACATTANALGWATTDAVQVRLR